MSRDRSMRRTPRCIECGECATELFKDYQRGVIKLAMCGKCSNPVDKYVEYDPAIILIDVLLFKAQAFRHIIFNTETNFYWKISIFCILCEGYVRWTQLHPTSTNDDPSTIIRYTREWDFYWLCALVAVELNSYLVAAFGFLYSIMQMAPNWAIIPHPIDYRLLLRALLLSNYGKLLLVPAVIWCHSHSLLCLALLKLFTLASNAQAVRVVLGTLHRTACALVLVALFVEAATAWVTRHLLWNYGTSLHMYAAIVH
uniref:Protein ARV n=1 Tax=Eptatretus burgeri TaxID=7764 RepID=A0A8C4Q341_EPTBU